MNEHGPIVSAAERVLSSTRARDVRLADVTCLSDDDRRNLLLRCRDVDGGDSFIIKKVVAEQYNPDDATSWDTTRFFSDWAGAEFLSAVLATPRTAAFHGGDRTLGFFILEDLGQHRSLVEPLLEESAAGAQNALLAYSASLGRVHAGTIGQAATFEQLLQRLNPQVSIFAPALEDFGERVQEVRASLNGMGVSIETGFDRDAACVVSAIEHPGPFLSYIHGDPCPDNVSWNGEDVRLIDFEFGGFGHALMDAAYGRMIQPSCWCANQLPDDIVVRMESVYRAELVKGCPEAQDDRIFEAALAAACGAWMLNSLSRSLVRALEVDTTWGIATVRQRMLARLQTFIATSEQFDQLPALRGTANALLDILRTKWPDTPPMPPYPAFRQ